MIASLGLSSIFVVPEHVLRANKFVSSYVLDTKQIMMRSKTESMAPRMQLKIVSTQTILQGTR